MQPRKYPRNIPRKPHYFSIELNDVGETTWRIPSMAKAAKVLNLLQTSGFVDAAKNANDGEEIVANLGDNLPALFACQGALLGVCWFHESQDLETRLRDFKNMSHYGEEVYEELHESGWELGHVQACFVELVQKVVDSFVSQKDIAEKVSFLAPTKGKPN